MFAKRTLDPDPIWVHRLIFASASVKMRTLLFSHENMEKDALIVLSDFSREQVKAATDMLYNRLAGGESDEESAMAVDVLWCSAEILIKLRYSKQAQSQSNHVTQRAVFMVPAILSPNQRVAIKCSS